jgi:penicillin-binding protein 1A
MLVRMLQNPSLHNPKRHAEQALKGREQVLWIMKEAGHITEAQYHELRVKPIDISKFKLKDHNEGTATYFREYLREYAEEMLKKPMSNGRAYDIYRDGLKIYVTIDSRMQAHAEKAAWVHLSEHQKKLFSHWPNWNGKLDNSNSGNPWTYREDGVSEKDIALRKQILERLIFDSPRFQYAKDDLMPTFASLKMREIDLVRMRALSDAERRKRGQMDSLLNDWYKTGYVDETLKNKYENLVRSDTWVKVEEEYKGVLDLFAKPVKMKVFAYNKEGEKDTTMSPLDSIRYHRMHLQTGCMAMDPNSGYVKAWVGGINHKYFKYDHVNRKAKRQVGSSIKGFLYALAVDERGYSSCYKVADVSTTIEAGEARFGLTKSWTPKNAGGGSSGSVMTLTQALTKSLNTVSAKLMKDMGSTQPFRNFLGNIGIDTLKIAASPTICLGAADISVFEMTGGYTMFANGGFHVEPIFIERIVDKNGYEIFSAENEQVKERVLSDEGAFVMNEMLQAVQRSAGGFTGIKSPHGGKTGTTNYQADGWYLGFTPSLVIGTWVGCDDRFIRFRNLGNGAGAKMARPIYQNFMRYVEADPNTGYNIAAKFPRPDIIQRETECGNFKNMNFGDEDGGDLPPTDVTNDTYIYDFD